MHIFGLDFFVEANQNFPFCLGFGFQREILSECSENKSQRALQPRGLIFVISWDFRVSFPVQYFLYCSWFYHFSIINMRHCGKKTDKISIETHPRLHKEFHAFNRVQMDFIKFTHVLTSRIPEYGCNRITHYVLH